MGLTFIYEDICGDNHEPTSFFVFEAHFVHLMLHSAGCIDGTIID